MKKRTLLVSLLIVLVLIASFVCIRSIKNSSTLKKNDMQENTSESISKSSSEITSITSESLSEASESSSKARKINPKKIVLTDDFSSLKLDVALEAERSRLTPKDQLIYDEFLNKFLHLEVFYMNPSSQNELSYIHHIIDAILGDYPEIRLFLSVDENDEKGFKFDYSCNWVSDEKSSSKFLFNEIYSIEKKCEEIISKMPNNLSTNEIYKYFLKEICLMTEYLDKTQEELDSEGLNFDFSYCYLNGPILKGEGLCQAYAYAYQLLCQRAGLWCVCVSNDIHCWNLVMLDDGLTYHVDPTWCDSDWSNNGYNTDYFLLTQNEIEETHSPNDGEWIATGK